MDLGWLEDPVLGPDILVKHLLIVGGIIFVGLIASHVIPRFISAKVKNFFVRVQVKSKMKKKRGAGEIEMIRRHTDRRLKRYLEHPLRRSLSISIILLSFFIALMSLDINLDTDLLIFKRTYQPWQFLQVSIIIGLIMIFVIVAIDPIIRSVIYTMPGEKLTRSRKYSMFRAIRTPSKIIVVILGIYIAIITTFSRHQILAQEWIMNVLLFTLILMASYFIAQIFVIYTEPSFKGKDRPTRNAGKVVGRLIRVGIYLLGGLLALTLLGLDLLYLATSLGLIGFALAFGLQDTVANFAAGIMIAIDKPFTVGDRIRIDWGGSETWGDVNDISLRSTWIKTPEGEMIVIPNNVIASSQVWNYTRDSPKVAIHFDVGISYDSDWKLAEKLILEILKNHPLVLNTPSPYILMTEFGNSAQVLTLWFWIPEARDKLIIKSDVLKKVKDSFDKNGVEIPFPYRTLVYKSDIQKPKILGEEYKSPVFLPSTGFKEFKIQNGEAVEMGMANSVILAPTSSPFPALQTAPYVMETAKRLGASVTSLFIKTSGSSIMEGQKALRIYNEMAKKAGVDIKLIYRQGDILENILMAVESENASIVIMGSTEESLFGSITKRSISQELLLHLNIPTMIVPINMKRGQETEYEDRYDDTRADLGSIKGLEALEDEDDRFSRS